MNQEGADILQPRDSQVAPPKYCGSNRMKMRAVASPATHFGSLLFAIILRSEG